MSERQPDLRPHFVLIDTAQTERFRSIKSGRQDHNIIPILDRQAHGQALLAQLTNLKTQAAQSTELQREAGMDSGFGIQIQFRSQPNVELAFESLARERQGIELLNVRHHENITYATVFVPDGKLETFERIIQDYLTEKRSSDGSKSLDNKALVNTIRDIHAATFEALWTDDLSVLPADETLSIWWEIWLPVRGDRNETLSRFRSIATGIGFELSLNVIQFPERTVLHMRGSKRQITQSMLLLNTIAEIRRAKETAEFFDSLGPVEQHDWVQNLRDRTTFMERDAPHICLLDTGVNRGHPLLGPAISSADLHTIQPAWGPQDAEGHGTQMAGLALFGDLTESLTTTLPVYIRHRLESVKLLPQNGANQGELYGNLTIEAVGRPEVTEPHRQRVFSMAITTKDSRDRGRPSAWSAALDSLACDAMEEGLTPRLIVVCGGNVEISGWGDYPHSNQTDGIHDPGQSWNAITVGAYTQKIVITEVDAQDFQPIAPAGSLSPFSTEGVLNFV